MRTPSFASAALAALLAATLAGCGAATSPPQPGPSAPPPAGEAQDMSQARVLSGSADSVGSIPGAANALYYYRFKQTEPGSDLFVYQDRELSFHFRPTPDVLFFQVENRTDKPVWLDWDRCVFYDPLGNSGRAAHSTTTWRERYGTQASTQILGLQRFGDFLFPIDYLLDPGGSEKQIHRAMFPEDESAPQYSGRDFGVDLAFRVENQPRTYTFRFKVLAVLPKR